MEHNQLINSSGRTFRQCYKHIIHHRKHTTNRKTCGCTMSCRWPNLHHKDVKPWFLCNTCNKQPFLAIKSEGDFPGKSNYPPAKQPLCVFHFRVCFCVITLIKSGQAHVLVGLLISGWFKVCGKKVNLVNATSLGTPDNTNEPYTRYTIMLSYF